MTTSINPADITNAQVSDAAPAVSDEQGQALALGETVEYVDPNEIDLGENVRTDASVGKDFLASVKADGFYQYPSTYRRASDGVIVLVKGQRRILAARMAGLPRVPVVVGPEPTGDEKTRTIARLVHQRGENQFREGLSAKDDFAVVEQMLNLGVSAAQTAKRLHMPRTQVDAAAAVAKSERARAELDTTGFDLVKLSVLAEFEDDEEAVSVLIQAAGEGQFEHKAEQFRVRNANRARMREAAAEYTDAGYTLAYRRPDTWGENQQYPLHHLVTAEGEPATVADLDPAHFTVHLVEKTETVDAETGKPVDDDEIDWDTEDDPDAEPAEGLRHVNTTTERVTWSPSYYCHDLEASGFVDRFAPTPRDDEDEDTAAARRAEAARTEEADRLKKSLEGKQTRALNPLCRAATTVRRDWVRSKGLRSYRKGMSLWAVRQLAARPILLNEYQAVSTAAKLIGCEREAMRDGSVFAGAGDSRAQLITCGLVLGALENRIKEDADNSWRRVPDGAAEYLRYLRELGYTLSEIEEVMVGERKPEDVTLPTE